MRLAHLSDLHIPSNKGIIYGVNPVENLHKTVRLLKSMIDGLDAIVVSGDISNDGGKDSYLTADTILSELGVPIYCTIGNHDSKPVVRDLCMSRSLNSLVFPDKLIVNGYHLIFLDSVIEESPGVNKSRGFLNSSEARKLDTISKLDNDPYVVIFHHPAVEIGGWMDDRILQNRDDFNDKISRLSNVICVLSGHNHYPSTTKVGHCLYSHAPSVSTTFSPEAKRFQEMYQPAFDILEFEGMQIKKETVRLP